MGNFNPDCVAKTNQHQRVHKNVTHGGKDIHYSVSSPRGDEHPGDSAMQRHEPQDGTQVSP